MKISYRGDYALKMMLALSLAYRQNPQQWLQTKRIAEREDIPDKFLEHIVSLLRQNNYLQTSRGAKGGVRLAKAPSVITVGEVIRLIDGTTAPIACVSGTQYNACDFALRCVFKPLWEAVRLATNQIVDQTTFETLCHQHETLHVMDYHI